MTNNIIIEEAKIKIEEIVIYYVECPYCKKEMKIDDYEQVVICVECSKEFKAVKKML